ncbi:MAG: hypothetical protein ACYC2Y_04820, partial [Armatimonadota bacterium]
MKLERKSILYLSVIAVLLLAAGILYANYTSNPVKASDCGMSGAESNTCDMSGMESDMSGCPMANSADHASSRAVPTSVVYRTDLSGSVLSINKTQRKISMNVEMPYSNE